LKSLVTDEITHFSFVQKPSLVSRQVLLSEDETQAILQHGIDCVESECSVDDVEELVANLKAQQDVLNERLIKVMNMVAHLQAVNLKKERKTNEVRAFVKDLLRVFNNDVRLLPMFPLAQHRKQTLARLLLPLLAFC
jgi:hypothetical protein